VNRSCSSLQRLESAEPDNAAWQEDIAGLYSEFGDIQMERGDLSPAIKAYKASLTIMERLAKAEPENAIRQHGLAMCYRSLALAFERQREAVKALDQLQRGKAIMTRLLKGSGWGRITRGIGRAARTLRQVLQRRDLSPAIKAYQEKSAWEIDLEWFDLHMKLLASPTTT